METEISEKYNRMQNRIDELSVLNINISRLWFYVNESHPGGEERNTMIRQLSRMKEYRDELQRRIENGWY